MDKWSLLLSNLLPCLFVFFVPPFVKQSHCGSLRLHFYLTPNSQGYGISTFIKRLLFSIRMNNKLYVKPTDWYITPLCTSNFVRTCIDRMQFSAPYTHPNPVSPSNCPLKMCENEPKYPYSATAIHITRKHTHTHTHVHTDELVYSDLSWPWPAEEVTSRL